jgi:hypothetical protein
VVRLTVAIVGDHMWAAMQGLAALDIDWDEGPNANLSTADIVRRMEFASQNRGVVARKKGDIRGLEGAAKKVETVYELPFLAHAAMEPMNCTVHVTDDSCEIWVGIQVVARAQATAAQVTGLPPDKIQVHCSVADLAAGGMWTASPRPSRSRSSFSQVGAPTFGAAGARGVFPLLRARARDRKPVTFDNNSRDWEPVREHRASMTGWPILLCRREQRRLGNVRGGENEGDGKMKLAS